MALFFAYKLNSCIAVGNILFESFYVVKPTLLRKKSFKANKERNKK